MKIVNYLKTRDLGVKTSFNFVLHLIPSSVSCCASPKAHVLTLS